MWDIFINGILPVWFVLGMLGTGVTVFMLCIRISEYREEKQSRFTSSKEIARRADAVIKAIWWIVATLLLPISIIPAILYFPFVWTKRSVKFFKELLADRKGLDTA